MVKETITYTDYDGVERTESFIFNLTKTELMQMNWETEGGLESKIKKIIDAKDQREIMKLFTEILEKSYGVKSPDGKRLMKSKEIWKEFEESLAFDEMMMKLYTDPEYAAEFVKKILPDV